MFLKYNEEKIRIANVPCENKKRKQEDDGEPLLHIEIGYRKFKKNIAHNWD